MNIRIDALAVRAIRLTGWFLLALVLSYLATGYGMTGRLKVFDAETALAIHLGLHAPLILMFGVHSVSAIYLALRRKRWIR